MAYIFLVIILLIAVYLGARKKNSLLYYFFFLYPILPEYLAINISDALPLLTASRLLFVIIFLNYIVRKRSISLVPLKRSGMYIPLIVMSVSNVIILCGHFFTGGDTIKDFFNFLIEDVIFLIIFSNIITDEDVWFKCLNAASTGAIVVFICGIIEPLTKVNLGTLLLNTNARSDLLMASYERYNSLRATFTFGHAICLAVFCVAFIPIYLERAKSQNRMGFMSLILCFGCLLMTISRWPIVVGVVMLLLGVRTADKQAKKKLVYLLCGLVALFSLFIVFIPSIGNVFRVSFLSTLNAFGANFSLEGTTRNSNAISSRLLQLQMITATWNKYPLIGYGSASFSEMNIWITSALGSYKVRSIDMEYLNWFVSYGLVGFVAHSVWYVKIIKKRKDLKMLGNTHLKTVYFCLIGMMICYFAVDQLTTNRIFNMFLLLLITGISIGKKKKRTRQQAMA